jgi:hypothetical protein
LTELAQREIKLRRQREALWAAAVAWTDEEHPELADGAYAWVRKIRSLDAVRESERLDSLERRREKKLRGRMG